MSYTLAYTGAEIDALLGKIDAIFVAEYGSTIYSEVTAAIAAGNKVIVANAGKVFVYAGTDDNGGYVFTQSGPNAAKPNATYVTLSTGNVWSTATVDLATLQQFYASLMEDTASGSIASFPDGAQNVPVTELTAQITPIQSGSGDPSPDNIRPILGYTGAEIPVTNKNLVLSSVANCGVDNTGTVYATQAYKLFVAPVKEGETYTITTKDNTAVVYAFFNSVPTIGSISYNGSRVVYFSSQTTATLTAPMTGYIAFRSDSDFVNAQLELGSSATEYEAPSTTIYSVSWSDHGTVYKGTAEYKGGGEWEISDIYGRQNLGSLTWQKVGTEGLFVVYSADSWIKFPESQMDAFNGLCDTYNVDSYYDGSHGGDMVIYTSWASAGAKYLYIFDSNHAETSAADFKTAMADKYLVYEKAAGPTTFTVSGPDPETLLGDNNIFSSTGNVSVKYRCNTALYIEKKLG